MTKKLLKEGDILRFRVVLVVVVVDTLLLRRHMAREKAEKGMAGQKRKSKDESAAAVAVDLF